DGIRDFHVTGVQTCALPIFKNPALKPLTGRTLQSVAAERGKPGAETLIDLIVEDDSRVGAAYFLMSEENVELGLRQPWVSLGSRSEERRVGEDRRCRRATGH